MVEKILRRKNHCWGAEAALGCIEFDEFALKRMKILGCPNCFDCRYFLVSCLNREDKAGVYEFSVHDDGADSAISSTTAFFRSFQSKSVS